MLRASLHSEIGLFRLEANINASASNISWVSASRRYSRGFKLSPKPWKSVKGQWIKYGKQGICQSTISENAPFLIAIGACIFSSLAYMSKDERRLMKNTDSAIGTDDLRNGAMTIISFIPIFNWLGWIFAWLDTSEQRYLLYASVYLAPYVWTGFSFSSDENWLLIFSYVACIAHTQIEIGGYTGSIDFVNGMKKLGKDISLGKSEFVLSEDEQQNRLVEEDITEIDLLEFDKKLSSVNGHSTNDVDQSSSACASNKKINDSENIEDSDSS